MDIARISAFSFNNTGGNPAGVAICEDMPDAQEMLRIAKKVGYSETVFLHKQDNGWRARYFAPEIEVPFCGHATIAAGYVLGEQFGEGNYKFYLNDGDIKVQVTYTENDSKTISLVSPPTSSEPTPSAYIKKVLTIFGLSQNDLDNKFPVHFASAGAKHLIIVVAKHDTLRNMGYDFEPLKELMQQQNVTTVSLLWQESAILFHARNPFPPGGVYEDPATGAAAAAFAGYLRELPWIGEPSFEILQGEDMGSPSRLIVEYSQQPGSGIKITGEARHIVDIK